MTCTHRATEGAGAPDQRAFSAAARERPPGRFDVGVVGCGRVGSVLGAALRIAGHDIAAVSAVSDASLGRAENLLPGVPVAQVQDVVARCQLVLLTVPDDVLPALVAGLAAQGVFRRGQLVVHTAGRYGTGILAAAGPDVIPLALHPAMTFTGTELDLVRLRECWFAVTAADLARPLGELIVLELGAQPVWVAEADRGLYHAALAHGANHLVTLTAQALQLLHQAGIERPAALLGPLVEAALDNALRLGDGALTGPVARGDIGTLAEHLHLLAALDEGAGDLPMAYRTMARATALRARQSGLLAPPVARSVLDLLDLPDEQEPR